MRLPRVMLIYRPYRISSANYRGLCVDLCITDVRVGSAMLRSATGSAPIKINKADVADPERFRDLMNTLERHKVSCLPFSMV